MIRALATILGVLAAAVALLGLVVRYLPIDHQGVLILAVASPYLMVAGPIAVLLLALGRRWMLTLLAVCLSAGLLVIQAPRYVGPQAGPDPSVTVRVFSANLGMGLGDPAAVVAVAEESADVVVLQELTPDAAEGLSSAGLDDTFAHRVIDLRELAGGIGIWSRHPIAESGPIPGYSMAMLRARLRIPGVPVDPIVVAVHFAAPWPQPIGPWREDMQKFPTELGALAEEAGTGAVIVAGDFNATADMLPFRGLLDAGYRDAAEQAGAGMTRSYPVRVGRIPLIGIDHILLRNCDATTVRTEYVPGADHLGLLAAVQITRGG